VGTVSEPLIPPESWDACALPEGFTTADGVAIMAIERGVSIEPWQFDWLARWFPDDPLA
jgi:hypothetical protein